VKNIPLDTGWLDESRALVLAHPRWYPDLPGTLRSNLVNLARSLAQLTRLDPADPSWLCGVAR
jgi:hypothetical protein